MPIETAIPRLAADTHLQCAYVYPDPWHGDDPEFDTDRELAVMRKTGEVAGVDFTAGGDCQFYSAGESVDAWRRRIGLRRL